MQNRHTDRLKYFSELAATTEEYFMPYIKTFHDIYAGTEVLEIGCGEGGNLLPFAKAGCKVTGIDISVNRIKQAKEFFSSTGLAADFINANIFDYSPRKRFFDIIGHQQICRNRFLSHSPFIHLFPNFIYRKLLRLGKESDGCIEELMSIKGTSVSIGQFHRLVSRSKFAVSDQQMWFINPHYKQKFGIKPRKLNTAISRIPYFRDFVTSAFICILKPKS